MQKPIIPLTLAYIAGLLLGHGFLYFPYSISILALLCLLTIGLFTWFDIGTFRRSAPSRSLLIILPALAGMAAYLFSAGWLPPDHYTRMFPVDATLHELTGRITSPLDRDPDRTGFAMELHDIGGTPVSGTVRVSVREELRSVGYGDTIRISGKLFEPRGFYNPGGFDYAGHLARSGVYYTVSVKGADKIEVLSRGTGIFRKVQDWRERIRQGFLTSTSGPGSALLQAMVLGEEGRLTDKVRDQFMAAGVTHIISISGSHLGMVAVLCFGLMRGLMFLMPERYYHRLTLCTDPEKIAAWLTLPLVVFYTLLAGGQVATIRSLVMIAAGLLALLLDRESALMHSLALAALGILIASPQAIFDISFQLSYLSVLVIGFVVSLWNELRFKAETRLRKIRNSALLLVIISLATGLATGPLVAHYFNQISLAGIVSNMIVVPFAGVLVVPLGLASGILLLFIHHLPLAGTNQFVSDLFVNVVVYFSRLPFAEFHPPAPGIFWLVIYELFLFSFAVHARERLLARFNPLEYSSRISSAPVIGMACSGVLLALLIMLPAMTRQRTTISFPDLGQGDSALIRLSSGTTILIDGGGTRDNHFDIGRRVLAPYLWNKGVYRLDLVILSHPHPDHMNGLVSILNNFDVCEVWESGRDTDLPGYDEFSKAVAAKKIMRRTVAADGPPVMLGEATLRVLHPGHGFSAHDRQAFAAENNRSLVVQVKSEGRTLLFTGDIGLTAEKDLMRTAKELKTDLIKVPHHGSKSSSGDSFVSAARPAVGVVTVGRGNLYRHPSEEIIARYTRSGATVYRTDTGGAITVTLQDDRLDTVQWQERVLRRVEIRKRLAWEEREQENWKRLWIRAKAP